MHDCNSSSGSTVNPQVACASHWILQVNAGSCRPGGIPLFFTSPFDFDIVNSTPPTCRLTTSTLPFVRVSRCKRILFAIKSSATALPDLAPATRLRCTVHPRHRHERNERSHQLTVSYIVSNIASSFVTCPSLLAPNSQFQAAVNNHPPP